MPPAVAIPLAALFFFAFTLIFGTPAAYPLFGGFILGYLFYDYTHYYVHHFVPKSEFGKRLREQHMRHHFQDHRYGYGVSSPLWDVVFRTLPRKRRQAASAGPSRLERRQPTGLVMSLGSVHCSEFVRLSPRHLERQLGVPLFRYAPVDTDDRSTRLRREIDPSALIIGAWRLGLPGMWCASHLSVRRNALPDCAVTSGYLHPNGQSDSVDLTI